MACLRDGSRYEGEGKNGSIDGMWGFVAVSIHVNAKDCCGEYVGAFVSERFLITYSMDTGVKYNYS